jgi:hypothetical protein
MSLERLCLSLMKIISLEKDSKKEDIYVFEEAACD